MNVCLHTYLAPCSCPDVQCLKWPEEVLNIHVGVDRELNPGLMQKLQTLLTF